MTPSELLALVDDRLPLDSRTYPTLDDYSAALHTVRERELNPPNLGLGQVNRTEAVVWSSTSPARSLDCWTIEVFHHDWHPLIDSTESERYLFPTAHDADEVIAECEAKFPQYRYRRVRV